MTWLDGDAPVFLAGGGGKKPRYARLKPAPVDQAELELAKMGRKARPLEPRACIHEPCGAVFTPRAKRNSRYCSKSCGMAASHARGERVPEGGTIAARARHMGITPSLVYFRVFRGWTLERALSEPVRTLRRPPNSNFGGFR